MKKHNLYIIAGPNGSGKTTFSLEYQKQYNLEYLNNDEIAKSINPSNPNSKQVTSGKIFFNKIEESFKNQNDFILETTLSGNYINRIITKATSLNYNVKLIFLFLDNYQVCIERISERVKKGGHHVPDEDVIRRFYRSQLNFWNRIKSQCDDWFLIYNSHLDFIEVAIGSGNKYTVINEKYFNIFKKNI